MASSIDNIYDLGLLFEEVQLTNVFPDNKTFPDCIPNKSLDEINALFGAEKDKKDFDLKAFVLANFEVPLSQTAIYKHNKNHSITEHLEALWEVLTRNPEEQKGSLIALPYRYVVPGGRFRECYYWDTYFTLLGLKTANKIDLIASTIDNFSYLIETIGHIPNGNRTYYKSRSQPPFYAPMVQLLASIKGKDTLIKYLPFLEKEYQFWTLGQTKLSSENRAENRVILMPDGTILNRYWDNKNTPRPESYKEDVELSHNSEQKPEVLFRHLRAAAESGWDFSCRWFKDLTRFDTIHTTDIIPVDLNALLVHLEETIAEAYILKNDLENAKNYQNLAQKRKEAIQKYCWNETKGFYFDFDFVTNQQKEVYSLAAAFPLFFNIADAEQARKIALILEEKFLKQGGLITTLLVTDQQWDAPNGWAPLQWIAYKGLKNYKHDSLALKIKQNWLSLNEKVYKSTGKMTEKYNVSENTLEAGGGEYPNQDGFGWTNGVYLAMLEGEEHN